MNPTKAPCTGRTAAGTLPCASIGAGETNASASAMRRALFRGSVCSLFGRRCGWKGRGTLAKSDRQLIAARQLFEMPEGEMLEEERRRPIEQRSPQTFATSSDVDQATLVKRLQ